MDGDGGVGVPGREWAKGRMLRLGLGFVMALVGEIQGEPWVSRGR